MTVRRLISGTHINFKFLVCKETKLLNSIHPKCSCSVQNFVIMVNCQKMTLKCKQEKIIRNRTKLKNSKSKIDMTNFKAIILLTLKLSNINTHAHPNNLLLWLMPLPDDFTHQGECAVAWFQRFIVKECYHSMG